MWGIIKGCIVEVIKGILGVETITQLTQLPAALGILPTPTKWGVVATKL